MRNEIKFNVRQLQDDSLSTLRSFYTDRRAKIHWQSGQVSVSVYEQLQCSGSDLSNPVGLLRASIRFVEEFQPFLLHKHQQVMLDTHPGKQWSGHAAITAVVSPNNICAFEWEMSYVNLYFLCNMYVKESCRVPGLEEVQEVQQKWIKNIMIMIIMIANITYQCDIPVVYFLCVSIIFQAIVVVHF